MTLLKQTVKLRIECLEERLALAATGIAFDLDIVPTEYGPALARLAQEDRPMEYAREILKRHLGTVPSLPAESRDLTGGANPQHGINVDAEGSLNIFGTDNNDDIYISWSPDQSVILVQIFSAGIPYAFEAYAADEVSLIRVWCLDGHDWVRNFTNVPDFMTGGEGGDFLHGGDGPSELWGGEDNDILFGGGGSDNLNGYTGNDLLCGGWHVNGIIINPFDSSPDVLIGGAGKDTFLQVVVNHVYPGGVGLALLEDEIVVFEEGEDEVFYFHFYLISAE